MNDDDDDRGHVLIGMAMFSVAGGLVGFVTGYTVASVLGLALLS